jgi:hypothetical protein
MIGGNKNSASGQRPTVASFLDSPGTYMTAAVSAFKAFSGFNDSPLAGTEGAR